MPSELGKSSVTLPVMYYFGNVTSVLGFLYFLEFSLFSVSRVHGVRSVKSLIGYCRYVENDLGVYA